MIIDDTETIQKSLKEIALQRAESDSRNYHLLNLLNSENPTLPFDKENQYPSISPFDICHTMTEKQKMLASVMVVMQSMQISHVDGDFFRKYDDLIHMYYGNMEKLDSTLFQNDPYLQKISLPLGREGDFLFAFQSYEKNRLFHYGEPVQYGYGDILRLAWFDENIKYPSVTKNGKYFSSISADMILSSRSLIRPASQNVLILGCGIGYLPYMIHRKESVSSVTIVDQDPDVIDLFENRILPQFDHPEKIHIIHSDAYDYMKQDWQDQWVIDDCYSESMEGVASYLSMKKLEHLHPKTKYAYWIEESVLSNLKSALLIQAMTALFPDIPEDSLLSDEEQGKNIVTQLKPFTDSLHITNGTQLKKVFSSKGLRKYLPRAGASLNK